MDPSSEFADHVGKRLLVVLNECVKDPRFTPSGLMHGQLLAIFSFLVSAENVAPLPEPILALKFHVQEFLHSLDQARKAAALNN
jgi:hypothetical protein